PGFRPAAARASSCSRARNCPASQLSRAARAIPGRWIEVDVTHVRHGSPQLGLDLFRHLLDAVATNPIGEIDAGGDKKRSRAEVHRAEVDESLHLGAGFDGLADRGPVTRARGLSDQQTLDVTSDRKSTR